MADYPHSAGANVCEARDLEITTPIIVSDSISDNLRGERFGKYLLVGEIALGGMAQVFLGVQRGLEGVQKVVVLKRVLPHFSTDAQFLRMFVDEARIAARLDHSNIVRTYEFGEVDGQYYTAMEYLPGEDLRSILRRLSLAKRRLPVHVAVGIVIQVCAGLQVAHQLTDMTGRPLNLVHRDVSPANIIVTYGGEVKLIDFGVAKTNTSATVTKTIKGKLAYMPPEQVRASGVDHRSDIFSAGVVLWELLTGRRLFGRASDAATLYAIMNDPVRAPSSYRPEIPPALDAIIMRAIARSASDRFASAEQMAGALEEAMAGQPRSDARVLAATIEELFGPDRANAKRAISQTRTLARNISLVMKLRTEVRADAVNVETLASGSTSAVAPEPVVRPRHRWPLVVAGLCIAGLAAGVAVATYGPDTASTGPTLSGAIQIESEPSGATISIGGEPTGLTTPATLSGLGAKRVTVRLELAGFAPRSDAFDVPATGVVAKRVRLAPATGRILLAGLPRGATLIVDGTRYRAGEAVDVVNGKHDVRVVVDDRTIVQRQLETRSGDQVWRLAGDRLEFARTSTSEPDGHERTPNTPAGQ